MPEPTPPSRRSWKSAAPGKSAVRKPSNWQGDVVAAKHRARRRRSLVVAGSLAALLLVTFVAVFRLYNQPSPAALVLIGSAYDKDLALPANYLGCRGLHDLEAALTAPDPAASYWSPDRPPGRRYVLTENASAADLLGEGWKSGTEQTLLVFVSLHGAADADGQPFLFLDDPQGKDRVEVAKLLDAVDRQKNLQKVLFLDSTQLVSSWPRGVLRNDFVAELKALVDRRRAEGKDKNLWVLCASGPGQRSWPAVRFRQTAFAHFVIEGLRGAADGYLDPKDNSGRVTLAELTGYVSDKVADLVRDERAADQRPILLPDGPVPQQIELLPDRAIEHAERAPATDAPAAVADVWKECDGLRHQVPGPEVYAPHLWRLYQDKALRLEQAAIAGDAARTADLRSDLASLKNSIEQQGRLNLPGENEPRASAGNSLPLAAAFGLPGGEGRQQLRAALRQLPDPVRPADLDEKFSQRCRASSPRPAEAHLALMFARDLVPLPAKEFPGKEIKLAVDLRLLAEEAALAAGGDGGARPTHPYSEAVFPHVRAAVDAADADHRRIGEDLVFAADADCRAEARKHFEQATAAYGQAKKTGAVVRDALRTRDRAAAELPYYMQWLLRRRQSADAVRQAARLAEFPGAVDSDVWGHFHKIQDLLGVPPEEVSRPDQATTIELETRTASLEAELKGLAEYAKQTQLELQRDAVVQSRLQAIEEFLTLPLIPADGRQVLLAAYLRIASKLEDQRGADKPAADDVQATARLEGGLGLAMLGPARLSATARGKLNEQLQADDFKAAGRTLAQEWQSAVAEAQASLQESGCATDLTRADAAKAGRRTAGALALAATADGVARTLDASAATLLAGEAVGPAKALRRLQLCEMLKWLAQRSVTDHWYEEEKDADPYYVVAANAYLDDARALARTWVKDRQLDASRQAAIDRTVARTGINTPQPGPTRPPLTGLERNIAVGWSVKADAGVPPGVPVVRVAAGEGLQAGAAALPRPLKRPQLQGGETVVAAFPLTCRRPSGESTTDDVPVTLQGLYRGQRFDGPIKIPVNPQPDVTTYRFPPQGSAFAVRAEPGALRGRLAIVLDASPSMGPPAGVPFDRNTKCKYHSATAAIRTALRQLPVGTLVSIWRFGGWDEVRKETIIRQVVKPTAWTENGTELDDYLFNLDNYDPRDGGYSPVARSMKEAVDDLESKEAGVKTLLVLTDGVDEGPPPAGKSKPAAIQRYLNENVNKRGISVQFVLFSPEEEGDRKLVKDMFECVQDFDPPGRIYQASSRDTDTVAELQKNLKDAMTPKAFLRKGGRPLPGKGAYDDGFPFTRDRDGRRNLYWNGRYGDLPPDVYDIFSYGLHTRIRLDAGDRLLLQLGRDDRNGLSLKRGMLVDEADAIGRGNRRQDLGDWSAAVLQNARVGNLPLQQLLTLEKKPPADARPDRVVEQAWPGFCWLQLAPTGGGPAGPVTWFLDHRYPAPTYDIQAPAWPEGKAPVLQAWWTEPGAAVPETDVGRFRVSGDEPVMQEVEFNGEKLAVWVEYQRDRPVRDKPGGDPAARGCLVLTFQTKDHPIRASVEGVGIPQGEEHRYYLSRHYYQAVFWGLSTDKPTAVQVRLLALDAFQKAGGPGVRHVRLDLDPPDDRPAAFNYVEISPLGTGGAGGPPGGRN